LGEKNIEEVIHYIVLPYGTSTYEEAKRKSTSHVSPEDIYEKCPKATVEYYDESKDLAIISFTTDEELSCLEISDAKLEKGDKIVTIGNIEEKSFVLSYGKILSNDLKEFHPDEQAPNKVLCHNAYEEPGCSGAACLNKEMKIVGINIGGNTDLLGRFKSGVMIPNTQILKLIAAWASLK